MSKPSLIGIDIGGTNCRGAVTGSDGTIGPVSRMGTIADTPGRFVDQLENFVLELIKSAGDKPIQGLGIGVPGIISPTGEILESPNLRFLDNYPLQKNLAERLRIPVRIVNDVNAIAWGETLYGAGRNMKSLIVVALGTGVGGGLVLDRQLWLGADGVAGEIGHISADAGGRLCGCGARGCLEQYASATGIVKSIVEMRRAGQNSSLDSLTEEELTSHVISEAARAGDEAAISAFDLAGARLGLVLAGVVNLLNPDGIVITGGVSTSFDLMQQFFYEELRQRCFDLPLKHLQVRRGELGDKAGILGAALLSSHT